MDYGFYNPYLLNQLETIDTEELMATPYAPKNFIVAEMLPEGLTLLCGPSKIGKSWLVLQMCICVFEVSRCPRRYVKSCLLGARCKRKTARSAATATI